MKAAIIIKLMPPNKHPFLSSPMCFFW